MFTDFQKQFTDLKNVHPNIVLRGNYVGTHINTLHECLTCGCEWNPRPSNLLTGYGCPECNESKGEKQVGLWLRQHDIMYVSQKRFDDCCDKKSLPFDFYLPNYNTCIEYQGKQHYESIEYFGGEENLLYTINDEMRKSGIPYFYNTLATDLDTFTGLINSGASDVYIGGNLGFEIKDISRIAHQRGIKIRVYPNKCQTNWVGTPDIKTFFIRPEDVPSYEPYIDVMEIWAETLAEKQNIDIYYKIYAMDKEWYGDLKEFLIGWNSNLDNRFIIPQFAEARLNCKKRCLKGHPCHVCERIIDISKKLKEGKVIVRYNKDYKASDDNIMIDDNTI